MFKELLGRRRAYRALEPVQISSENLAALAEAASLAPSCFNNQPWRYVFVTDRKVMEALHEALTEGNYWARKASLIIAAYTFKELDCVIRDRTYAAFDTGMATFSLIMAATEMGLVAHPIAGFSPSKVAGILKIEPRPDFMALIIVGRHSTDESLLEERHRSEEKHRPPRKNKNEFVRYI
jgi:nitroreductase